MDFFISPATAAEVPALVALVNRAYRGELAARSWTSEGHLLGGQRTDAADLRELLAAPDAVLLQARNAAHELLGSFYLRKQADTLHLGMLAVAPDQQARGIGKRLLQAAEAHARQAACTRTRMTVISIRPELLAWYERQGYRRIGATEPFPTDSRFGIPRQPLELLVLEKLLAEQ